MSNELKGIKRLLSIIGGFFVGLFDKAKKAWNHLSEDLKDVLLKASGVVAFINDNTDKAPDFVWELIKKKFPDLTEEKFKEILATVQDRLGIATDLNNADLLTMLQAVLNKMAEVKGSGSRWAEISHGLYVAISVTQAPKGTKLAAIVSLAEFVYHEFFKRNK